MSKENIPSLPYLPAEEWEAGLKRFSEEMKRITPSAKEFTERIGALNEKTKIIILKKS